MKILNLKRTHRIADGTLGVLDFDGIPFCVTCERPWKNNEKDVSHIPIGEYLCERQFSPSHNCDVYWLRNVPNRGDIEIHVGNTMVDSKGCILIGHGFAMIETKSSGILSGIQESKDIFNLFMAKLKNDPQFKLVITEV